MKLVNLSHCRPNLVRLIIANVEHFLESKKTYKNCRNILHTVKGITQWRHDLITG